MKSPARILLFLPLTLFAGTITPFNEGWRFARFGPMPDGSTLAEPVAPFASARASSEEAAHPVGHAFDGDPATRWCAADSQPGQTLTIDLGREANVDAAKLVWEKPGGLDLAVAISLDGEIWIDRPGPHRASEDSTEQEINFDLDGFRYLRLTINGTDEKRWASIAEITFLDDYQREVYPLDPPEALVKSPAGPGFNDSKWRTLSLPHDWGIEGPFRMELDGSTGKLPWAGIGWYRKSFTLPPEAKDKRYFLQIDGAMSNSTIYLNGQKVGGWPYGYTSYDVELTSAIKPGAENLLAIRLDNQDKSSRWYPGGGIYRDVRLVEAPSQMELVRHLQVTTPQITPEKAVVKVMVGIESGDCPAGSSIEVEILSADGKVVATSQGQSCEATLEIPQPTLWTLEKPYLYTLRASHSRTNLGRDTVTTRIGIRSLRYDANEGFFLNGVHTCFKGVCLHHDLGPLGSAWHPEAAERQLRILKEMGCNAIRTCHNPPAPGLADLCDRLGILLQIEAFDCWDKAKSPNDYARHFRDWHVRDLTQMVSTFSTHPSVVMWSIGNEINGGYQNSADGWQTAADMRQLIKEIDKTRPVSMGNNDTRAAQNLWKGLDIIGFNYKPDLYPKFRAQNTGVPVYGSETASTISSRGEYFFPVSWDKAKGQSNFQISSYDLYAPPWAQRPDIEFEAQDRSQPWNPGEFVWTGFDYLGEPTPYNNDRSNLLNTQDPKERERLQKQLEEVGKITPPSRSSYFGISDLCGFPKDRYYLYQARWRPELPMAHILPHWNWPGREGEVTPVHVYTSGDEAELFLNGRSLGRKKKGEFQYRLVWDDVKYQPGELRVVSYKKGEKWAEDDRSTTGRAAKLLVQAEPKLGKGELIYLTLTVADDKGRLVPRSNPALHFEVGGAAEILTAGNGDATSHVTMHRATSMPAYNGLCQVILRRTGPGKLSFKATTEGLTAAEWTEP